MTGSGRRGFSLPVLIAVLAVVTLAVVLFLMWSKLNSLETRLNDVDAKGRALREYVATTNDAGVPDYTQGNLTSYLGWLAHKISDHIEQPPAQGHGHADNHQEPPPPPPW